MINGYGVAAPQVTSDLLFGNLLLSQPTYGEGLLYVGAGATGGTITLSGAITARNFTKFGEGALRLTGNLAGLEGNIAINSGTVTFGGSNVGPAGATLSLNDLATLNLAGANVYLGGLAGTQGVITNLSAGTGVLTLAGTQTTTFSGVINDGSGTTKLVKKSGGNLTLTPQTAGSVMSGNNTFTGGVDLYNGSLIVQNPYGLGGYNGTTPGLVSLYGGILNLQTNAGGVNGTSIFGNPSTLGLNIAVLNATTINVDRFSGTNTGNAIQIGSLTLGNTTLSETASNSYRLRVAGTTTIQGSASLFSPGSNAPGALELMGNITDSGAGFALNKTGAGYLIVSGTNNTFTGGANVLTSVLQVTGTTGTPLGTGPVIVNSNAALRIAGGSLAGVSGIKVYGTAGTFGAISLDTDSTPSEQVMNAFASSPFGATLNISVPEYNGTINLASTTDVYVGTNFYSGVSSFDLLGSILPGRVGALGTSYAAPTGATGVYRFAYGTVNLAGADNTLSGTNVLMVGSALRTLSGDVAQGGAGITLNVMNSNSYTGGTVVNRGSTLTIQTGGAPGGASPLGSGTLEIGNSATVNLYAATGSLVNASTGTNNNTVIFRPNSVLNINNNTIFTGAGGQDRWADAVGMSLNGGGVKLTGAPTALTTETIGVVDVSYGAGAVTVAKGTSPSTATLTAAGLVRGGTGATRGGLLLYSSGAYTLGVPATTPLMFDRFVLSTGTAGLSIGGTTIGGTGVLSSGSGWLPRGLSMPPTTPSWDTTRLGADL